MDKFVTHDFIVSIVGFQSVILLIIISNIWITRRDRRHPSPPTFPKVSVLVPARNEERNISDCVSSLLAQDYPEFEVLVYDDQSTDNTYAILEDIASHSHKLIVLSSELVPGEINGKSWACAQLADRATGEILFFTDADTFHQPNTLKEVVIALVGEKAAFMTGYPHQEIGSWGERLLVPFFSWAMICFNPLLLAYQLRFPALSSAVGQMMVFRREAYFAVGGHQGVVTSIVDDFALVRKIVSSGFRWRVVHVSDLISCRMYRGSQEAYYGFIKNFFAAFDYRLIPYLFAFTWLTIVFWVPLMTLFSILLGSSGSTLLNALLVCISLSFLVWCIPYLNNQLPFYLAFIYPVTMLANFIVALQSLRYTISGKIYWKGRQISGNKWKWL